MTYKANKVDIDQWLRINEQPNIPGGAPPAGVGTVWVKNNSPNEIHFADDTGTDHNLIPVTTKGDIYTHDGTIEKRLPVGSNGYILTANSSAPTGLQWNAFTLDFMNMVQARRTTGLTLTSTIFSDVDYDITDIENNNSILSHNDVLRDEIMIGETGYYLITYAFSWDPDNTVVNTEIDGVIARVQVNNATTLPGSTSQAGNRFDGGLTQGTFFHQNHTFVAYLTVSDIITVQIAKIVQNASATSRFIATQNPIFTVVQMKGPKGDKGNDGAGSNITINDEAIPVTGTPHTTLNFTGFGVTATNAGGGTCNITIPGVGNGGGVLVDNQIVSSTVLTSTTSGVYIDLAGITLTTTSTGTYSVFFNGSASLQNGSNSNISIIIVVDGIQQTITERDSLIGSTNERKTLVALGQFNLVSSGSVIKVAWRRSAGVGTIQFHERSLMMLGFNNP